MYAYFTIEKSLKKVDCGLGVVFRRLIDWREKSKEVASHANFEENVYLSRNNFKILQSS
jgi:hypothetical protein